MSLEDIHDHADEKKLECRWHNLIYEFMQKVFFHDDDFLPSKKADSDE